MFRSVKNDRLFFDGVDMAELAKKYGTPLYVYSENDIISRFEDLRKNFVEKYDRVRVAYAAKAFFPLAMAKLVDECGMCVDVVSGGELYTAIKAGFPAEKIEFNGNNKSIKELEMAVEYEIGRIIVDSLQEVALIEKICKEKGKIAKILFRVTPGVKSDSHDYIVTGKKDSKFGIPLDDEVILPQIKAAIDSEYIDFYGIHFHVGSQLFDNNSHLQATDIILNLVDKVRTTFGYEMKEINVGGGFGVTYVDEKRQPYTYFLDPIMTKIEEHYAAKGVKRPNVVIEPGRSIVAEAGLTLYTIGSVKQIPGIRKYVSVDGGMGDNPRYIMYESEYTAVVANNADAPRTETVTIAGKCCESGDLLLKDAKMPKIEVGDTLAVLATGAYNYSMASNYNRIPRPAVVAVSDGNAKVVVKRESYEDLVRNDL